jgi:putative transposase
MTTVKSIKQPFQPTPAILQLIETFRQMVNDCIRMGLENNTTSMKRLSMLSYPQLARYQTYSNYKLTAISKAAGILKARKKSIQRGYPTKDPYMTRPILVGYLRFRIRDGTLKIPVTASGMGHDTSYFDISLNSRVKAILADRPLKVRSFTVTSDGLSLAISKEVAEYVPSTAIGVDRNLANVRAGNTNAVVQYDVSKTVAIADNNRSVNRAFRRNDARVGRNLTGLHGKRRHNRVNQLLHLVSKSIVKQAKDQKAAIALEDIIRIRNLYRRGNGQSHDNRAKMNSWPFHELKRQIEYKAAWEGVPIIKLTKGETRGTSKLCYQCGERLQGSRKGDKFHRRDLWCKHCKRWFNRDVVGAMNISYKALLRFGSAQGAAGEAMVKEPGSGTPAILLVDAAKLSHVRYQPRT